MLNDRLNEMQTKFSLQAIQFHDAQQRLYMRLQNFEKLKPAQYGLLDMSIEQIIEAVSVLESDPQKIWDLIEKFYCKNFFEKVIIKRYAQIFENRDEAEYVEFLNELRK